MEKHQYIFSTFGSKINEFEWKKSEMNDKSTKTQELQAILVESGPQSDNIVRTRNGLLIVHNPKLKL